MLMISARVVQDAEDGRPVLRVQVSRDGAGGTSSAVCPIINKSGLRAVLAALNEDVLKFLSEDLKLEYVDG